MCRIRGLVSRKPISFCHLRDFRALVHACKYSSLTFLMSDGAKLYSYRDYSQVKSEDYHGLMYAKEDGMMLFTQEPTLEKDWIIVSNRCLVVVNKELRTKNIEFANEKFK